MDVHSTNNGIKVLTHTHIAKDSRIYSYPIQLTRPRPPRQAVQNLHGSVDFRGLAGSTDFQGNEAADITKKGAGLSDGNDDGDDDDDDDDDGAVIR